MKIYTFPVAETKTGKTFIYSTGLGIQAEGNEIKLLEKIASRLGLAKPQSSDSKVTADLHITMDKFLEYFESKTIVKDDADDVIRKAYQILSVSKSAGPPQPVSQEDEKTSSPTDIYIGALDAECKPLLAALMKTLEEDEGVLVVYKQRRGMPADSVYDARVSDFTGGLPWAYCATKHGTDSAQVDKKEINVSADIRLSADTLEKTINAGRTPTSLFSLPGATTVASDTDRFGVGVLSRHGKPVTKIRAVVVEPLNMGLNGDLVQHELTSTLTAIHSLFAPGSENRPLRHYTWGVGAASSPGTGTGDLLISDVIIDFRVHYNPIAQVEAIRSYVSKARDLHQGGITESKFVKFMTRCEEMIKLAESAKGRTGSHVYTGAAVALELTGLAHMACDVTGLPMRSNSNEVVPPPGALQDYLQQQAPKWPFYSEVTLRTPRGEQVVLYHSGSSESQLEGGGKKAYQEHMDKLHDVMRDLSSLHHPDIVARVRQQQIRQSYESTLSHIKDLVHQTEALLSEQKNNPNKVVVDSALKLQKHALMLSKKRNRLLSDITLQDAQARIAQEKELQQLIGGLDALHLDLQKAAGIQKSEQSDKLLESAEKLVQSEKELTTHFVQKGRIFAGGILLWSVMQQQADSLPANRSVAGLDVTHSGSKFFTEPDKAIAYVLGGASVEMENQLFALSIDTACATSGAPAAPAVVTKLAGDPHQIPNHVRRGLNEWAQSAQMSTDDYIDAMTWVRNGQDLTKLPESGRWRAVEAMCNAGLPGELTPEAKLARSCFANIGPTSEKDEFVVLNPFWLDIGTSLAKEASSSAIATPLPGTAPQSFPWRGEYGEYRMSLKDKALEAEDKACSAVINAAQKVVNFKGEDEKAYRQVCRVFLTGDEQTPGFLGLQERAKPLSKEFKSDVHRVHSRQNSMFKTGYVGPKEGIDWDSALYKSSQTVIMAKDSPIFIGWTQALSANNLSHNDLTYKGYRAAYLEEERNRASSPERLDVPAITQSLVLTQFVKQCKEHAILRSSGHDAHLKAELPLPERSSVTHARGIFSSPPTTEPESKKIIDKEKPRSKL